MPFNKTPHRFAGLTIVDWIITTGGVAIGALFVIFYR